jgi:hypothetical protein
MPVLDLHDVTDLDALRAMADILDDRAFRLVLDAEIETIDLRERANQIREIATATFYPLPT